MITYSSEFYLRQYRKCTSAFLLLGLLIQWSGLVFFISYADYGRAGQMRLNPLDYGLPSRAREVLSQRTLDTVTFDLGADHRVQKSISPNLFTTNDRGTVIQSSLQGHWSRDRSTYQFHRLPQGLKLDFDVSQPRYTSRQDGFEWSVSFEGNSGPLISDQSLTYGLPKGQLQWTVLPTGVQKDIWVDKTTAGKNPTFAFTIHAPNLTQELNAQNQILLKKPSGEVLTRFAPPVLQNIEKENLPVPISLQKEGSVYTYVYDDALLPNRYIIDPTQSGKTGNSVTEIPNAFADSWDAGSGDLTGSGPAALQLDDNDYVKVENPSNDLTKILNVTDFGFTIPTGATLGTITMDLLRMASDNTEENGRAFDENIYLLVNGVPISGAINMAVNGPGTVWPLTEDSRSYDDIEWSTTTSPTVSQVNNVSFGVSIQVELQAGTVSLAYPDVFLEQLEMSVFYTGGATASVPEFNIWALLLLLGGCSYVMDRRGWLLH